MFHQFDMINAKSSIKFFLKNLTLKYVFVLSQISIAKCVLILDLTERKGTHFYWKMEKFSILCNFQNHDLLNHKTFQTLFVKKQNIQKLSQYFRD